MALAVMSWPETTDQSHTEYPFGMKMISFDINFVSSLSCFFYPATTHCIDRIKVTELTKAIFGQCPKIASYIIADVQMHCNVPASFTPWRHGWISCCR